MSSGSWSVCSDRSGRKKKEAAGPLAWRNRLQLFCVAILSLTVAGDRKVAWVSLRLWLQSRRLRCVGQPCFASVSASCACKCVGQSCFATCHCGVSLCVARCHAAAPCQSAGGEAGASETGCCAGGAVTPSHAWAPPLDPHGTAELHTCQAASVPHCALGLCVCLQSRRRAALGPGAVHGSQHVTLPLFRCFAVAPWRAGGEAGAFKTGRGNVRQLHACVPLCQW